MILARIVIEDATGEPLRIVLYREAARLGIVTLSPLRAVQLAADLADAAARRMTDGPPISR